MGNGMEQRSLVRIPFAGRGKVAALLSAEYGPIFTANVSRQGICFYSPLSLPLGSEVILEIEMGRTSEPAGIEHLRGRILWKREWEGITLHGVHLPAPLSRSKNPRFFELTTAPERSPMTAETLGSGPALLQDRLTRREHEIIRLIARGTDNRRIARRLSISIKAVETHRNHIFAKLKVQNAEQLLRVLQKSRAWVVNRNQTVRRAAGSRG